MSTSSSEKGPGEIYFRVKISREHVISAPVVEPNDFLAAEYLLVHAARLAVLPWPADHPFRASEQ